VTIKPTAAKHAAVGPKLLLFTRKWPTS
jgi:hypothetical protein